MRCTQPGREKCMRVYVCVRVCVSERNAYDMPITKLMYWYVYVRERDRQRREREKERERERDRSVSMCVCVCVCKRERESLRPMTHPSRR